MSVLSVRIDTDLESRLEFLLKNRKITDKSAYLRQLLDKSIQEDLFDFLALNVKNKQMTVWKAAEIAKVSLRQMMHELAVRNIDTYDDAAFQQDLEFLHVLRQEKPN